MRYALVVALVCGAGSATAGGMLGEWRTEPDSKGQTGDVRVVSCGAGFCGTIVRAHDSAGSQITTKNVGRQILFDFVSNGSGAYEGEVFVPLMSARFDATITVNGGSMTMRACNAVGLCRSQTWARVN